MTSQFCPECGKKAPKLTDKCCRSCGHRLDDLAPSTAKDDTVVEQEIVVVPKTSVKANLPERRVIILSKNAKGKRIIAEDPDDKDTELDEGALEVEIDGLEVEVVGSYKQRGEKIESVISQGEGPPQVLNRRGNKVSFKKVESDLLREAGLRKEGESTEVGG